MSIRRATPADAPAIARVHVSSWQAAYRGLIPDEFLDRLSVSEREATWDEALATGSATIFVAEDEAGLSGFSGVSEPTRDDDEPAGVAEVGATTSSPRTTAAESEPL